MRRRFAVLCVVVLVPLLAGFGQGGNGTGLWERMCEACHDGRTVLNGRVVIDKEAIKARYRTVDELVKAVTCEGPPCMNILKHDEKLVRKVGKELGIKDVPAK